MLTRLRTEERGIALLTALLVSMIVLALGLVAVGVSLHDTTASSLDRKRTQASCLDESDGAWHVVDDHRDATGEQIGERLAASFVWNMQHVDSGHALEKLG